MSDEGDGFEAFFAECLPVVVALAERLTGERTEAGDVPVEAFGRSDARWGHVRTMTYRRAWVIRVATNLVIGQARRRRRPLHHRPVVSDLAEEVALRHTLLVAVAGLPRRQRQAVALRYLADLPEADVAAAMGVSTGSVKTH